MEENKTTMVNEPALYHTKIKDWPEAERPREKLMARGVEALSDAELLAILIHSGSKKVTALDLGKTLLMKYQSLRNLSRRTIKEITFERGIGPARAVNIIAAFEIGRRMQSQRETDDFRIRSPHDIADRFIPRLRDQSREIFLVLLLSTSGRIIKEIEISKGTVNASLVHPREVFKHAVTELATSIVLVHNHPGGTAEPSPEDRTITRQLVEAGKFMDIPVQDHVIVSGDAYVSFAEKGWM